ncbi:MAG: sulfite exporter TauE/SafE family protein [Phycisphaerae bacterium]|jgi:hypothetical protein|nr:sulfite exporter TauE/SafE family protein [Phycisphaerae bacterium]
MIALDELLSGSYFANPAMLIGCLLAVGLCIGTLAGLFGVGGGFLTVPILESLFGFNFTISVGSNLAASVGTSAAGTARHGRLGNVEPRTVILLALGSVPGALLGAEMHQWLYELAGDGFRQLMRCLFVALMLVAAWLVWRGPKETTHGKSPLQRLPIGPYVDLPRAGIMHVSLPGIIGMGLGVGVLVGLMGVGGGVLFMPLLVMVVGMSVHQAVGTSLGVVLCSTAVAVVRYGFKDQVSLWISLSILTGSAIGVQFGSWLCNRLHARKVRRYFALLVLGVAAMLAVKIVYTAAGTR